MATTSSGKFRFIAAAVLIVAGLVQTNFVAPTAQAYSSVPGQTYMICDNPATYLTSSWSYHALASGSQSYDVADYEALAGYGTALPPLPSYITSEAPTTDAAVIFAPGASVALPAYDFPMTPLLMFFEGGQYGELALDTVSGDEFIGGSSTNYPEPMFDSTGHAGGIDGQNGSFYYSGGNSTLAAPAAQNDTSITTTAPIPGYLQWVTFADGSSYQLSGASGTTLNLATPLASAESSGSAVWANSTHPIATVASSGSQGSTSSLLLSASTIPLMQYGSVRIGSDHYRVGSVSGLQSGYSVGVGKLDTNVAANTPVYYDDLSGDVTVSYLDIAHDSHNTTGTIYTGAGWMVTHNNIHDGYKDPAGTPTKGLGVAIYGGDEGTIEFNCLSKMGDYGINVFGDNNKFDYNEVYESNYLQDPGCGCSGGGKWWGTLNADIVDNAFVNDSPGQGGPVWLDNGNTGTNISGNFFDMSYGSAISAETGFNLSVTGNLFLNGGWGDGTGGCGGSNCAGSININSTGGTNVPNSRYEDQVSIANNQFINDWMGIDIWQSGGRSCENSGEGWPADAGYCSGGYPNDATTEAGGQYYFSHSGDFLHGFTTKVSQPASATTTTVLVNGPRAIDDQVNFTNPSVTSTNDTTNVSTFSGSGTIVVGSTSGFPLSGQLMAQTSNGYAVLDYSNTTATSFTGVLLVAEPAQAGSGTLAGSIAVNDPTYMTTPDTTDVSTFNGSGTINVPSNAGFPKSGELRVGTSAAWGNGQGSWTGAILSYNITDSSTTTFEHVAFVSGSGTLSGPVLQVQPYKVTSQTCYANDCALQISPALTSSVAAGTTVTNAGTCQLFANSTALPAGPLSPSSDNESYFDGCQWNSSHIAVSSNTFVFQPSLISSSTPLNGGTVTCNSGNYCGSNFMADQYNAGELPFNTEIGSNAMMSNSTLTGCPTWDPGCSTNPLANLNAGASPPGAAVGNGEAPYNNIWSGNTFSGPWAWSSSYIFGNCFGGGVYMPTGLNGNACTNNFSSWQTDWEEDVGSTYNPLSVSLSGLFPGQEIHSPSQPVTAFEDSANAGNVTAHLKVGAATDSTATLSTSPHNFSLNTLNYPDGQYTVAVDGTDSANQTASDSVSVLIGNGDLNDNKHVDLSDLAVLTSHWLQTDPTYADGNITGNSTIDLSDLAVLAANWGWSHP